MAHIIETIIERLRWAEGQPVEPALVPVFIENEEMALDIILHALRERQTITVLSPELRTGMNLFVARELIGTPGSDDLTYVARVKFDGIFRSIPVESRREGRRVLKMFGHEVWL